MEQGVKEIFNDVITFVIVIYFESSFKKQELQILGLLITQKQSLI